MRWLQKQAVLRPVGTSMFYLALILMGLVALSELEVNLLPDLEFPRITIITTFEDTSPEEVENLITAPITEAVGGIGGVRTIESESMEGISLITLQFDWGTDVDYAAMNVREKVDALRYLLPRDAGRSIVTRFDPAEAPFMEIVFFGHQPEQSRDLRHFLENDVKVYLDRIDGVALVELAGGYKKEVQVLVDQTAASSHGLSLLEIGQRLQSGSVNIPAGSITVGSQDILIRTLGEYRTVHDIEQTVVGHNDNGIPIVLSSVAEVVDGYRERTGLAHYNGSEAVILSLRRESGKNIVNVAGAVRGELARIRERFGERARFRVVYDESRFVRQSISNITTSLAVGGLLAFLALVLILRNLRSPLVLLCVLPVAVSTTFLLMAVRGLSINMMSLGGLALGIGMLFDSGNVVLTAIERKRLAGLTYESAAVEGTGEVTGSISVAVLTTVIVFLPIVFLESVVGVVFAEMALTITFALIVSWFVSLTLIPMLSAIGAGRTTALSGATLSESRFMRRVAHAESRLQQWYARRLEAVLREPGRFVRLVALLLLFAIICLPFVRREFVPPVDTGEFRMELRLPRGTALEGTTEAVRSIEETFQQHPAVEHIIARIGYDPDELIGAVSGESGMHRASLRVVLRPDRDATTTAVMEALRAELRPGADLETRYRVGGDILSDILSPDAQPVQIDLAGDDLNVLAELGHALTERLSEIEGIYDAQASMTARGSELHVLFDEWRMQEMDLSHEFIARYISMAIKGEVLSRMRVGDDEIDVRLRLRESDRDGLTQVERLQVLAGEAQQLELGQLARIDRAEGYNTIMRVGSSRINRIGARIAEDAGRNSVLSAVQQKLDELRLPEGYQVISSGEQENMREAFRELSFAFGLAVVLIFMLLAAQFESVGHAARMLGVIPLILIGVVPALLLTGSGWNVSSFTGLILLVGIVVDSAALFYEYLHIHLEQGQPLRLAVLNAGGVILRPVIMNSCTTALALLPVALELGEGTEFQSPMAIAVISGLMTAVFLSLFLVPLMFYRALHASRA